MTAVLLATWGGAVFCVELVSCAGFFFREAAFGRSLVLGFVFRGARIQPAFICTDKRQHHMFYLFSVNTAVAV